MTLGKYRHILTGNSLITVSNAICRINRQSVLRIDHFSIVRGQHYCVFGPNGAGKSLLAALLAGKRRETGSYVSYGAGFEPGRDCLFVSFEEQQRLWQHDNRLDMSEYSELAEDAGTTVADLILCGDTDCSSDDPVLARLAEQLNLNSLMQKGIRFLSSGQIRRVLIARALFAASGARHKLIVFDDPLEAIDRDSRERIAHCIEQHLHCGFTSILLCRRRQDILPAVSHMTVMEGLTVLTQGTTDSVMASREFQRIINRKPSIPATLPDTGTSGRQWLTDKPLVELKNVDASYGQLRVLSAVNWTMTATDHVLVEGPNGCGKSTLLSLIDGENHKGYGQEVYLFGQRKGSGETIWDIKARFGVVSNELHNRYVKGWKVLDVVVSGFFDSVGLYDDSGSAEWDGARAWLQALGIAGLERHYYHELSFGQQRLVLLARAMVKQPAILVLDEPCVGLDDYHRQLILGTLSRIADHGATRIIYVSHVADEEPEFITQRLCFKPAANDTHTIEQLPV